MSGPLIISLVMALCIVVMIVCMLHLMKRLTESKSVCDALLKSYSETEELNRTLRAQRHDQLNHIQVVYGMLEMEEYEEAMEYLRPVFKDIQKTGKALKTSIPALNAMLMAKDREAQERGVDFYVEVSSELKELGILPWELCKVLSNIIDNALTALEEKEGEKKISISILERESMYVFDISNNGPEIPKELRKDIFKVGFSSKKESGHGFGLDIVTRTLKASDGKLSLISSPEETVFTITLPKKHTLG